MAELLAVPNWSFGPDSSLIERFRERVNQAPVALHYLEGDRDHHRTVLAVRGKPDELRALLLDLTEMAFPEMDLSRHVGVHPRIGALDVCPFVPLPGTPLTVALEAAEQFGEDLARRFHIPVFLYELSHRGNHAATLPELRKGGFEALQGRLLEADYGPNRVHARWGATNVGVRPFLIAMNANLASSDLALAKNLASAMRRLREEGNPTFAGVRALGLNLGGRGLVQVSMNLTQPDVTSPDAVLEHLEQGCEGLGTRIAETELIGVIRDIDLPSASQLPVEPAQVVRWADSGA